MKKRRETNRIFWHCTATPEGMDVGYGDLWRWHVSERGWSHIGYHYLIRLDGRVVECRPEEYQGAGVSGWNADSVHIAYAGGIMNDGSQRAKDTRTEAQTAALYDLTRRLLAKYDLGWDDVYGHNEVAAKACPSFDVNADLDKHVHDEPGSDNDIPRPEVAPEVPFDRDRAVRLLEDAMMKLAELSDMLEDAQ